VAGPRLLVVLAHPDDETFLCGGALAAFAAAGGEVHLVCATRGEHGRRLGKPPFATRESLPRIREAELRAACAALGVATLTLLGLRDKCLEFEDEDALAARVAESVRRLRPDAVLTFHERRGGHTDHCTIGRAAALAWLRSGDPAWHPEQLRDGLTPFRPPRLYFLAGREVAEHPERYGLTPAQITVVDVAPVARQKMEAHRAHRTQTQLDAGLWGDDAQVLERFARGREYYEQATPPFVPEERGLLGLRPADPRP
jgi:bacillithiol biosynthesis deacetylase BshB2